MTASGKSGAAARGAGSEPLAFSHARDPACRYWEERRKSCELGGANVNCHLLATLYRHCPGKEAELVERVEADTVEAAGAAVPSSPSPPGPFGADPFEAARRQMEEAFSFEAHPAFRFFFDNGAGPGAVPPPAQHRHRYGRREPQQPDQAAGAAAQGRWQQYDSEDI
jgi:hypothetical protein